jgi:hypothetical protein
MAAKRYNRRSKDEWKSWVAKWKASGLGGTRFAEQHDISDSALYRWAHIFEDEAQPERKVEFKPVRVRGTSTSTKTSAMEIVTPSGWVVRVVGDIEADRLRAVLEVVRSC